ncbi:MAG: hypothetical protein Kow0010_17280 [Dehalococcoidia bacterium]
MEDWNTVVTVREDGAPRARKLLRPFGELEWTGYYNVLVMRVDDREALLEHLRQAIEQDPKVLAYDLSRVVPGEHCFSFQDAEEFEQKAAAAALQWLPLLGGKAFHVRLHRRGFKGRLSSPEEERFLDRILLAALDAEGTPGRMSFDDPDVIIVVEVISNRACLSAWTREQLRRYPFLRID